MSQSQLAKELGVSFATVNRWENQNIEPQIASLGKFNDLCQKKLNSIQRLGVIQWMSDTMVLNKKNGRKLLN